MEIENSLYISGLFDNFYVKNNFFHFCQNDIFGSDLVISIGNSIRREENLSAIKVNHTNNKRFNFWFLLETLLETLFGLV